MNETSLIAYWKGRTSRLFSAQQVKVLSNLELLGPATRAEIARRTGLRVSAVCGRVNELIKAGIVEEFTRVPDPDTLRPVWALRVK